MKEINWGIIGCGDVAEVKSGPAFQRVANSNLLMVMRRNEAKAKDFSERHNVPFFTANADNILKIVDGDTIDAKIDLGFDITIKKRIICFR